MPRNVFHRLTVIIALGFIAKAPLAAQTARPFSMDVTIGASTGWGGRYFSRPGVAAEVTLTPEHEAARVFAITFGGRGTPASGDICVFDNGPGSRCLKRFPAFAHLGVITGVERQSPVGTVRAMLGPAFYAGQGASALATQLQLDASAGFRHVAFMIARPATALARFQENGSDSARFRLGSAYGEHM